jgi:hypothetical protein
MPETETSVGAPALKKRQKLWPSRHFNRVSYDPNLGVVEKSSDFREDFTSEIMYLSKLHEPLKIFFPRVYSYSLNPPVLRMEYYNFSTVSEVFVYGSFVADYWNSLFRKIRYILETFHGFQGNITRRDYERMYYNKTVNRLSDFYDSASWNKYFSRVEFPLKLNGKKLEHPLTLYGKIKKTARSIFHNDDNCVIHGDLCFTNILYEPSSGILRLIDPRGDFGVVGVYGDRKYDLAKLRHSLYGRYDFIISDLFTLKKSGSNFSLNVREPRNYTSILDSVTDSFNNELDSFSVRFIEALLFLSMTPLHEKHPKQQAAMFLTGLQKLNEVFD